MSKNLTKKDLEKEVMQKIISGDISMKPKGFFVAGSVLTIIGVSAAFITSIFLINLISFLLRKHGPMGQYRLSEILASFPIWLPFIAVLGIGIGINLLKRYDFSYRKNFKLFAAGIILAVIFAGFLTDKLGLNDVWAKRGYMRNFYRQLERSKQEIPDRRQFRRQRFR